MMLTSSKSTSIMFGASDIAACEVFNAIQKPACDFFPLEWLIAFLYAQVVVAKPTILLWKRLDIFKVIR